MSRIRKEGQRKPIEIHGTAATITRPTNNASM